MSDLEQRTRQGHPAESGRGGVAAADPRLLTPARIGLERTGVSLRLKHVLDLAEAQALARDAVHAELPGMFLVSSLRERGLAAVTVKSAAMDRAEYLRRPDLGRHLAAESIERLGSVGLLRGGPADGVPATLVSIMIADGLSALAAERHALPVIDELLGMFKRQAEVSTGWMLAPVVIAEQARVALGDAVAQALKAEMVIVLIGERPGLSSPDSLGAYVTWRPRVGSRDAERNCVSNIRVGGLGYEDAAARIAWYCMAGRSAGVTGVNLLAGGSFLAGGAASGIVG